MVAFQMSKEMHHYTGMLAFIDYNGKRCKPRRKPIHCTQVGTFIPETSKVPNY